MKFLIFCFLLISVASAASPESPEIQEFEIEPSESCQHFLQTSLENDNFGAGGDDGGYTHGHQIQITESCNFGRDRTFSVFSRLFTQAISFYVSKEGKVVKKNSFEEENSVRVEETNWRDFRETYHRFALILGTRSRNRILLSGLEQKMFHKVGAELGLQEPEIHKVGKNNSTGRTVYTISGVAEYEYLRDRGHNKEFIGGSVAFGKSYSLDDLIQICDKQCRDYFRVELGMELISLKQGSNLYIFSEWDKKLPDLFEDVSIFVSTRAQRNEDIEGVYNEITLGFRWRTGKTKEIEIQFAVKKRNLPEGWNELIPLDDDEDNLVIIGFEFPF